MSEVIVFTQAGANWREAFVPYEDPNARKTDYVGLFGAIAQILASMIAIIVVVKR